MILFRKYHETALGGRNGKPMFEHLRSIIEEYNNSGRLQYRKSINNILHCNGSLPQARELCYMDALHGLIGFV